MPNNDHRDQRIKDMKVNCQVCTLPLGYYLKQSGAKAHPKCLNKKVYRKKGQRYAFGESRYSLMGAARRIR